jgi:hypothetical protein
MTAESIRTEEFTGLASYAKARIMQNNPPWLLAAHLHRSHAQARRPAFASRFCITLLAAIADTHGVSRALNSLLHAPSLAAAGPATWIRGRQPQG